MPSAFDIAAVAATQANDGNASNSDGSSALKTLRVLRVLRLFRLLRLAKASTVFGRLSERLDWPLQVIRLCKLFFAALLVLHAFACTLGIFTSFAAGPADCWLSKWGFCAPMPEVRKLYDEDLVELRSFFATAFPDGPDEMPISDMHVVYEENSEWLCEPPSILYAASLMWGFNLLTGGADYPAGGPFLVFGQAVASSTHPTVLTTSEIYLLLLLKVAGAFIWSYIFGELVVALSHGVDPAQAAYDQSVDLLNSFCRDLRVPSMLGRELRRFLGETRSEQTHRMQMDTVSSLPPRLISKLSYTLNLPSITRISCFHVVVEHGKVAGEDGVRHVTRFFETVALTMTTSIFVPQDRPPPPLLYLIQKGLAQHTEGFTEETMTTRVLGPTDSWGSEDIILQHHALLYRTRAVALSYLHVMSLSRRDFEGLTEKFPVECALVRRRILRETFMSDVMLAAHKQRMKNWEAGLMDDHGDKPPTHDADGPQDGHIRDYEHEAATWRREHGLEGIYATRVKTPAADDGRGAAGATALPGENVSDGEDEDVVISSLSPTRKIARSGSSSFVGSHSAE